MIGRKEYMRFTDESYEMFFAKWVTDERCSALAEPFSEAPTISHL